jgi:hypothetical protein
MKHILKISAIFILTVFSFTLRAQASERVKLTTEMNSINAGDLLAIIGKKISNQNPLSKIKLHWVMFSGQRKNTPSGSLSSIETFTEILQVKNDLSELQYPCVSYTFNFCDC